MEWDLELTCTWALLLIRPVEGEGVAGKINDVLAQVKLLVNIPHGGGLGIHALKGLGVVLVKVSHKDQKLAEAALLEHSHQIWRFNHWSYLRGSAWR